MAYLIFIYNKVINIDKFIDGLVLLNISRYYIYYQQDDSQWIGVIKNGLPIRCETL